MEQDIPISAFPDDLGVYSRAMIEKLGSTGTPPEFGLEIFTVGLEPYLKVIEQEYLDSFVKAGGAAFKLVVGSYGGGKTHFLYCVREIAWKSGFATAYVSLSARECPFSQLELVYKSIMANITPPLAKRERLQQYYEKGIDALMHRLYTTKHKQLGEHFDQYVDSISNVESSSFLNAAKTALRALKEGNPDYPYIIQWLKGEDIDRSIKYRYGITENLDRSTAFRLLRSLAQWLREVGYNGIVLLFDEAERGLSLATLRERRIAMDNLRQLIDECGNMRFAGVMIFYAVPDERQLLEEHFETYEALKQRLSGSVSVINPSGVKIYLEHLEYQPKDFLFHLGIRLAQLYEHAYSPFTFVQEILQHSLEILAEVVWGERYADIGYRRLFVKSAIVVFHFLRNNPYQAITKHGATQIIHDQLHSYRSNITEREF